MWVCHFCMCQQNLHSMSCFLSVSNLRNALLLLLFFLYALQLSKPYEMTSLFSSYGGSKKLKEVVSTAKM